MNLLPFLSPLISYATLPPSSTKRAPIVRLFALLMNSRAFVIVIASLRARVPTLQRTSLVFQIFSIWEFTGAKSLRNPLLTTHSSPDCTQSDRSFCVHPPNERLLCSFAPIVRGRSRWAHTRRDVSYESCLARPDAKTPHNVAASKFQARLPIIVLPPLPWG